MAREYSQEEIRELYEGDQSKLYSGVYNHHHDINSVESKTKIKKIVRITLYLAIVTILEISLGLYDHHNEGINRALLISVFFIMTILKAYLIVDVFMHLGDELRNFVMLVLIPMILVAWAVVALMGDGDFWLHMNNTKANTEQFTPPARPK